MIFLKSSIKTDCYKY